MADETKPGQDPAPLTGPAAGTDAPLPDDLPPRRPEYTRGQRLMALGFAILVVIITLMYTYAIATGDLFFR